MREGPSGLPRGEVALRLAGARLHARPSGALHWPGESLLVVGDLHLGRAERLAREGGGLLPPYETADTLNRLDAEIGATGARTVVCLGDSFDDLAAARNLAPEAASRIARLAAGRRWVWITGNHDPGPVEMPGATLAELARGPLRFRHIAGARAPGEATAEISAHYHPKARLTRRGVRITRPCFLLGGGRLMLPAFGTYTGGLDVTDAAFRRLFDDGAVALLIGERVTPVPLARLEV